MRVASYRKLINNLSSITWLTKAGGGETCSQLAPMSYLTWDKVESRTNKYFMIHEEYSYIHIRVSKN